MLAMVPSEIFRPKRPSSISARVKGKTHWQWVFGAATAVAHVIAPTRGKIVPIQFLNGARPEVWLSDGTNRAES